MFFTKIVFSIFASFKKMIKYFLVTKYDVGARIVNMK